VVKAAQREVRREVVNKQADRQGEGNWVQAQDRKFTPLETAQRLGIDKFKSLSAGLHPGHAVHSLGTPLNSDDPSGGRVCEARRATYPPD